MERFCFTPVFTRIRRIAGHRSDSLRLAMVPTISPTGSYLITDRLSNETDSAGSDNCLAFCLLTAAVAPPLNSLVCENRFNAASKIRAMRPQYCARRVLHFTSRIRDS